MFSRLVRWLQPLFLCLAALAIAWFLRSHWATLRAYPWRLDPVRLAAAGVLLLLSWALEVAIWRHGLQMVGGALTYLQAVRIWFLSAVVRYIPGNIWQPLSLTLYCRRYGVTPEATLTSIAIFQAVVLLAVAPMFAAFLLWGDRASLAAELLAVLPPALLWLLLVPVLLFVLRPQWLISAMNWGLVRLRRAPLQAQLSSPALAGLLLAAAVDWLLWGATFAAFTLGVAEAGSTGRAAPAPLLIISYPIAYAVGFLSLITPSGFGVREGAFYLLLVPPMDGAIVTVVALAMRVWTTLGELLMALFSAPFERTPRSQPAQFASPTADAPVDAELRRTLT